MKDIELRYTGLIAACGMNCGLCIGYLREKKPCSGCSLIKDANMPQACRSCKIVNCDLLASTESGFCFDCEKYPCSRLKMLDKRYRTKYGMSMIENLAYIKDQGLDEFIKHEQEKWKCKVCGAGLSVHRKFCLQCKTAYEVATKY
ncbi:MAG: DUF3795 domain-containing protein [Proteiniphilum sp.]|jgi:hypothetical protein|nr:DUF3795 domain-containing protein [Proteiniphilum sp.]MDD2939014.1 DUF3795 domain-containing protein [Proteiniphilum sp.]MDD3076940.1 DUF3795 domain-containing protein [Proteiniphilum sp.]MDD3779713.1 DUF3795 domain-containing protein [Proteiniphilum sp.]MDD3956194.1 DUF3795 domain-containing protein [Proteiniphilum sp.]